MLLTATAIRNAKPKAKSYKLTDGAGLYLQVNPNGSCWWRFYYYFGGKQKTLSLGVYPEVGLKEARENRELMRRQVADGIDPSAYRKLQKTSKESCGINSFKAIALEWFIQQEKNWVDSYSSKVKAQLENDLFPWLGTKLIHEIEAPEVLTVLRRIENRGAIETAHRAMRNCSRIFRYAIATGRVKHNVVADLCDALAPVKSKRHASITDPKKMSELLRNIDGYQGTLVVRCALKLAPLLFVRPGELRHAKWAEMELEEGRWYIPAEKMKLRIQHVVPLSRQAVAVLRELHPLTGTSEYVFPNARSSKRAMSENAVLAALRCMGYTKEEMTGHGFRSMASTSLNEQEWLGDAIERQLAHGEKDQVRAAYNYAKHLPKRVQMMQAWADYLDTLKAGAIATTTPDA